MPDEIWRERPPTEPGYRWLKCVKPYTHGGTEVGNILVHYCECPKTKSGAYDHGLDGLNRHWLFGPKVPDPEQVVQDAKDLRECRELLQAMLDALGGEGARTKAYASGGAWANQALHQVAALQREENADAT